MDKEIMPNVYTGFVRLNRVDEAKVEGATNQHSADLAVYQKREAELLHKMVELTNKWDSDYKALEAKLKDFKAKEAEWLEKEILPYTGKRWIVEARIAELRGEK